MHHGYDAEKIRKNASTFHQNFSTGDFDKNGPLVNEKIYVNLDQAVAVGRDKFVAFIKGFSVPFPKLQLKDRILIVDGNEVGLLYIMQGTHDGPFGPIPPTGRKVNVYACEYFTMDKEYRMKELLTITRLDQLVMQLKSEAMFVNEYETVTLLPIRHTDHAFKHKAKDQLESYVQNFNVRNKTELQLLFTDDVKVQWNDVVGVGKDAVWAGLNTNTAQFPDLTFHLEHNIVEGDRGAIAYTMIGTHTDATTKAVRKVAAKEGAHVQFAEDGKIMSIITVSNTDDIKSALK